MDRDSRNRISNGGSRLNPATQTIEHRRPRHPNMQSQQDVSNAGISSVSDGGRRLHYSLSLAICASNHARSSLQPTCSGESLAMRSMIACPSRKNVNA